MAKSGIQWKKYIIYILVIPIMIFFYFNAPIFFTWSNFLSLLVQSSVIGIVAIGMTYVIITAGIDLSVGSILYVSGIVAVILVKNTGSIFVGVMCAIVASCLLGAINGFIITKLKLVPFVVTLATMSIFRGFGHVIVGGRSLFDIPRKYSLIGQGKFFFVPIPVLIFLIISVLGYIVLKKTKFGLLVCAVGNEDSARAAGINVTKIVFVVYTIIGVLAGLGGIIITSRVGGSQFDLGVGLELASISAVIIGGTSFEGGEGNIIGTVLGAVAVGSVDNILRILEVSVYYYKILWGMVILSAVLFNNFRKISSTLSDRA